MFVKLEPEAGTSLAVRDLGLGLDWEIGRALELRRGVAELGARGEFELESEALELLLLAMV